MDHRGGDEDAGASEELLSTQQRLPPAQASTAAQASTGELPAFRPSHLSTGEASPSRPSHLTGGPGGSGPGGAQLVESTPLAVGDMLGRYQIRRLLGEGGMGRVYLGRDAALGRSVALKVVRSVAAGTAQAARILNEARVIASLNHPHIVQLYDVGEHAGSLYLALEYVDGDTLPTRTAQTPPSLDEGLRYARAIADALVHAHAHGVFHCDLKPGNVMVGRDGRLRVVDFGIAHTADLVPPQIAGTPEWMAPEQWDGKPLTDRVDIWALGILTLELLSGRPISGALVSRTTVAGLAAAAADARPTGPMERSSPEPGEPGEPGEPDEASSLASQLSGLGIPPPVVELIARSLELHPAARPSALEWRRVLDEVAAGRSDSLGEEVPFRGLSSFDEPYARFFFGREADVDAFLERLRDAPCLPIVGPSGVGKSSFLHAGVIPRLRARERWTVLTLRPGAQPIAALARQVLLASGARALPEAQLRLEVVALEQQLRETPTLLAARLATLAAACGHRVLLAIDQLEEVFTQGASEVTRQRFLEMILAAADDAQDPVRVAFTLRDDFLGRIPELRSLFVMRRMSMDELRRTILGPLQRTGYRFDDPAVVDEMLAEISGGDMADLPLVQFACRALWDGRDPEHRLLRRATYVELGGISGALGRHAEAALAQLSSAEYRSARQLLLPLVGGTTRRSIPRSQLLALAPRGEAVLDRLLAARLLVQHTTDQREEPLVEIAHESLLSTWPQLVRWLEESRDERRLLAELMDVAALWRRQGRRVAAAWSVGDLEAARHRAAQLDLQLPPEVMEFFAAVEHRHGYERRRRLTVMVALTAILTIAAVVVLLWMSGVQLREKKALANFGRVELRLRLFDYGEDNAIRVVDPRAYPELRWRLHAAAEGDEHREGEPLPAHLVSVLSSELRDDVRIDLVEAPGGMAFLKIEGRGKAGERCAPSMLRLRSLPGYSISAQGRAGAIDVLVPTCAASRWGMVEIPAGPFVHGGAGEPPSAFAGEKDYQQPEEVIDLPGFWLDRTEVSNAAFAAFAHMESVTGYPSPIYADDEVHRYDGEPQWPVTEIDAFEAEAFCRFLGKTLPTERQWVKAARGGLTIAGQSNPRPRRLFPWGDGDRRECVNLAGEGDWFRWTARVTELSCGASPYGILQLTGNVEEWLALDPADPDPLRVLRAGSAESPFEREHHSTIFRNHRDARFLGYNIGVRCAVSTSHEPSSFQEQR
jgi:eukaryotic-like serine/threonine-protein kinase